MNGNPTDVLRHEHDVILRVLDGIEREVANIRSGGRHDPEWTGKVVAFIREFADRWHHGKEERHLFALLVERGMSKEGGPVGVMLREHDLGRSHVAAVAAELAKPGGGEAGPVADALEDYVDLLRNHIRKENDVLFPMADRLLGDADRAELAAAFERVEREASGDGARKKFHEFAREFTEARGDGGHSAT